MIRDCRPTHTHTPRHITQSSWFGIFNRFEHEPCSLALAYMNFTAGHAMHRLRRRHHRWAPYAFFSSSLYLARLRNSVKNWAKKAIFKTSPWRNGSAAVAVAAADATNDEQSNLNGSFIFRDVLLFWINLFFIFMFGLPLLFCTRTKVGR